MTKWKLREDQGEISVGSNKISEVLTGLLRKRGIIEAKAQESFLFPDYVRDVHDPFSFVQMEKVVARIDLAKQCKEKIFIFGDYDADGITSSAILREVLLLLGVEVEVYIPDKKTEGYSMNIKAVEFFARQGAKLIITVDCGITSIKEVQRAKELGMDVIITDHHHVPEILPEAYAIINPHMKDSGYPFAELAGVGVTFKVVQALFAKLLPEQKQQEKWMLDLVAIGTVADCVPLVDENRVLVKYGLVVLGKTRRAGLKELFKVGRMVIDEQNMPDARKISFQIAPRINAAGRIDHANLAYNLVIEQDPVLARDFALELEDTNTRRQKMTEIVSNEIKTLAENMFKEKKFIFALGENFPVGVVGLVAGKIASQFNKPTIVLQKGATESVGSLRSIPQVNIIEAVEKCAHLLKRFGGHAQAAGLTVSNEKLDDFYKALDAVIEQELVGKDLSLEIEVDAKLNSADIDFLLVDELEKMRPFGEGNAEPVFLLEKMKVHEMRIVGNGSKHAKILLQPRDGSPKLLDAISFNAKEETLHLKVGEEVDVLFSLQSDEWNGNKKIQLNLIDLRKTTA